MKYKLPLVIAVLLFTVSCASSKFLGTKQPDRAARSCPIESNQCSLSHNGKERSGIKYSIIGSYFLESLGGEDYSFSGSAKLAIDHAAAIGGTGVLNIIFVFYQDDVVVHEEKIRLKGSLDKYHEFSLIFKSDVVIESSNWAWFSFNGPGV